MRAAAWCVVGTIAALCLPSRAEPPTEHVVQGPLPAKEGWTISGTLVGPGTEPVWLHSGSSEVELRPGDTYRFVGTKPGRDYLYVDSADGRSRHWDEFDVFGDVARDFVLPTAKVRGKVTRQQHGESGELWIGLDLVGGFDHISFEAAADGTFESPAVLPGRYDVSMEWRRDGSAFARIAPTRWTTLDVGPDGARLDFDFKEPAFVGISVRAAGDPESFEGRMVTLDGPKMQPLEFRYVADTDAPGTCVLVPGPYFYLWSLPSAAAPLTNMVRGSYKLRFVVPGFVDVEREVTVGDGRTTIEVQMRRMPGSFVHDEFVAPAYEVFVRPAGDGPWKSLLFADNRRLPTHTNPMRPHELLAPGRYEFIETTDELAASEPQAVDVPDGHKQVKLGLTSVPAPGLRATLKTPSGAPLSGVGLTVLNRDRDGWRRLRTKAVAVDEHGAFAIRGLSPGGYRITYDEAGEHVAGEFEMKDADVTRNFVFKPR